MNETVKSKVLPTNIFKSFFNDYKQAMPFLKSSFVRLGLLIIFFATFASSAQNIAWPLISKNYLQNNPMFLYGMAIAAWGLGNTIGIYIFNILKSLHKLEKQDLFLFSALIMSLGLGLTVIFDSIWFIFIFASMGGIGDGVFKTIHTLYVQDFDDEIRSKIFSTVHLVNRFGFAIGFIVLPILLNIFSIVNITLMFYALLSFIVVLILFSKFRRNKNRRYS